MIKKQATFTSVDFLEGRSPSTITAESTELRDAALEPIVRLTIDGLEVLIRRSDLLDLARMFA